MYNDSKIPSVQEFALLAREYAKRLEGTKKESSAQLLQNLYELNFLYAYIKRNVRSQKIINLMQRLEHQTLLDVSDVCSCLSLNSSKVKFQKKKYNNLRQCLKQAIKLETKVLTFLFENKLTSEIAKGHLNNISQLAMLL